MLFSAIESSPQTPPDANTPEQAKKVDNQIKILTLIVAALAAAALLYMLGTHVFAPSNNYKNGIAELQEGSYAAAVESFTAAGDYKDAPEQLKKAKQLYADLLAGKENALSYVSAGMPWLSIDENGKLAFAKDAYEEAVLPNPGEVLLPDLLDGKLVTSIKDKAFLNADTVTSVVIPDSVAVIPDSCFYNCTAMQSIQLGAKTTAIAQRAFLNCTALTELTLPATVSSIGLRAFNSCYSLQSVTIQGDLVTVLEPYTFSDCVSMTEVTIPASVRKISENAFTGCASLKTVYFGGTEEEWNAIAVDAGNEALDSAKIVFAQ